jgi:hypothetical protein
VRGAAGVYRNPDARQRPLKKKKRGDRVTSPWPCGQWVRGNDGAAYFPVNTTADRVDHIGWMRTYNLTW